MTLVCRAFLSGTGGLPLTVFAPERTVFGRKGIGEDQSEPLARITGQRVGSGVDRARVGLDNAVQIPIHHAQPSRIGDKSPAVGKVGLEMPFLVLVHVVVVDDMIVGGQQEAAGAAGRVADGIFAGRLDAIDDGVDQFAGSVSGKALATDIPAQRTDG